MKEKRFEIWGYKTNYVMIGLQLYLYPSFGINISVPFYEIRISINLTTK